VSQWMMRGLGGRSSPGAVASGSGGLATGEGGDGPITAANEWLEEGSENGFRVLDLDKRRRGGRARRAGQRWPFNDGQTREGGRSGRWNRVDVKRGGLTDTHARAGLAAGHWRTSGEGGWWLAKKLRTVRSLVRGHQRMAWPGKEKGKWARPSKTVSTAI
jgi:hypothetical protein